MKTPTTEELLNETKALLAKEQLENLELKSRLRKLEARLKNMKPKTLDDICKDYLGIDTRR